MKLPQCKRVSLRDATLFSFSVSAYRRYLKKYQPGYAEAAEKMSRKELRKVMARQVLALTCAPEDAKETAVRILNAR